jgi:phosphatidylserine/phosphatidylglycerophosphate/cardiolipin synthase-like enzyme
MIRADFDIEPFVFREATEAQAWDAERRSGRLSSRPRSTFRRRRPRGPWPTWTYFDPPPAACVCPAPVRDDGEVGQESFSWPLELEWEGEVNRSSSEYIRWVQSSLNRTWGLRLAVDGIAGPETRAAVRSFQQRQGLTVDGIVGPITEAALVAAGAPAPPQASVSSAATGGGSSSNSPLCSITAGPNCEVLNDFVQGSDTLTPKHREQVKRIAERLINRWETHSLLIRGHASLEGLPDYNYELGVRRAGNVSEAIADEMDALVLGSSSYLDWEIVSCGEANPIAGASQELLRRVEVCFIAPPRWYETGGNPPNRRQPVRAGNDVQYFVDGPTTFKEMVRVIRTAKSRGHFIYLLGWWMSYDFELIPGDHNSTMLSPESVTNPRLTSLLENADRSGVQVRAMLWDQWEDPRYPLTPSPNGQAVRNINGWLNRGAAIHDNRVLSSERGPDHQIGSHHQKVLIVKGSEGLIAFCGGIDINPDRIHNVGATIGAPFQDVHCCIKGPAAHDLLTIFLERWKDHPDSARPAGKPNVPLLGLTDDPVKPSIRLRPAGKIYVQIGRTYGNGNPTTGHPGVGGGYSFAPDGERTVLPMILKAITEARKFIYIEDQYLVSMEISQALVTALQNNPKLIVIILIPHESVTFLGFQTQFRRRAFIAPLRPFGASRVGVFFLGTPQCNPGTYVHSKMMVVDDEYAIVGSANLARRSLTHDSEAIAGICDTSPDSFAKRLRVALWAKHLGKPASGLSDGVASAKHWFALRPGTAGTGGICVYQENLNVEANHPQAAWDETDPNGR